METQDASCFEIEIEDKLPRALLDEAAKSTAALVLLPERIEDDGTRLFASSTTSVRKVLQEQSLAIGTLSSKVGSRYREDRSFEWVGPTLLIPLESYLRNKALVDVAVKAITAYVTSLFRGREHETTVRLDVLCVRAPGLSIRRIKFRGPPDGLKKLAESVRATMEDTSE